MSATRPRLSGGREKILAATKDLLWECGYEQMSPRDIMDRSGAGQGSLYHHFGGKLEVARAALGEMVAEEIATVDAVFDAGKPPLQRLRDYFMRQRQALRGCRIGRLSNEPVMQGAGLRDLVAAYLDHIESVIDKAIREGQADGSIAPAADANALAAMFASVVQGGFILARAHWDAARMERALRGAEMVLEGLTKSHPAVREERPTPPVAQAPIANPAANGEEKAAVDLPDGGFY